MVSSFALQRRCRPPPLIVSLPAPSLSLQDPWGSWDNLSDADTSTDVRGHTEADTDPALLEAVQDEAEACMLLIGFRGRRPPRRRASVAELVALGQVEAAAVEQTRSGGCDGGEDGEWELRSSPPAPASKRRRVE